MTISTNPITTQDIQARLELLDNHLSTAETCAVFLSTYNTPNHKRADLDQAQHIASVAFQNMFTFLSEGSLENCKRSYESVSSLAQLDTDQELKGLVVLFEAKIAACGATSDAFRRGIVKLLQTVPGNLLRNVTMMGFKDYSIGDFSISECHCHDRMEREPRGMFSHHLIEKIQEYFPGQQEICITSLGAGGCFHELTIHALLAKAGCKAHWNLVDPATSEYTICNFEKIANWITPNTTVKGIPNTANSFFESLKNKRAGLPDVCLFIDVDVWSKKGKAITNFGSEIKHNCLFATLSSKGKIGGDFNKYPIS